MENNIKEPLIFDLKNESVLNFIAKEDEHFEIVMLNIPESFSFDLILKENATVRLSFLATSNIKNLKINGVLLDNSTLDVYFADFSNGDVDTKTNFDLNGNGASLRWHLASLSKGNDDKHFSTTVNHNVAFTHALVDSYGVCQGASRLVFSGDSYIKNGSIKSSTVQNAKIMIFDNNSKGIAKPILKIDENDIIANHAAVVGEINEEHLFYLTSRGISIDEAKRLITYGYLKPILMGFSVEEHRDEIISLIEGNN